MQAPREHLAHLVRLAGEPAAASRRELLSELGALLTAWPENYPIEARASFAALLARVERDADPECRRDLARQLACCPDAPLDLVQEFFFELPLPAREKILLRAGRVAAPVPAKADEAALVAAARTKRGSELVNAFAAGFRIDALTAMEILQDTSGVGLALACRGAGIARAIFSALAVLTQRTDTGQNRDRLGAFDAVPEKAAAAMLTFWRRQLSQDSQAAA